MDDRVRVELNVVVGPAERAGDRGENKVVAEDFFLRESINPDDSLPLNLDDSDDEVEDEDREDDWE